MYNLPGRDLPSSKQFQFVEGEYSLLINNPVEFITHSFSLTSQGVTTLRLGGCQLAGGLGLICTSKSAALEVTETKK
ncbi:hypothetical protein [Desulfolucanica intricata]|uniref:hypothetical protein n=1 Tax=Desulfolucanica intricata TaxID=1285191 RepID=UPI0013520C33|nr:hypothetical protein [Desulfolucanica intricata]